MFKRFIPKHSPLFLSLLLLHFTSNLLAQKTTFKADFAPTENIVKPQEGLYRTALCLNGSWKFYPIDNITSKDKEKIMHPAYPLHANWETRPIKVPSPWNVNNFATENLAGGDFVTYPSYPKRWESVRAGWMMRRIPYQKQWKNKRLILRFEAVAGYTQVYINKQKVGENFDVFLPFEIDVTDKIKQTQDNELAVWVADAQLLNDESRLGRRNFVAGSFWGQHIRGIWQDVNIIAKPNTYIENTYINPVVDSGLLHVTVTITNNSKTKQDLSIAGAVTPWVNLAGYTAITAPEPKWKSGPAVLTLPAGAVSVLPNTKKKITITVKVNGRLKNWTTEHPELYGLTVTAKEKNNNIDQQYTRFGWRQFALVGNQFYLNGKPLILKGDSWHFMGIPQMTRRYAWAWYTALHNANANAVRLHAQPYPAFYLDMADEMGICVLDETGMWASDAGPKIDSDIYWERSEDHLKRFIMRDRNHPSVFGWSVCNENLAVTISVLHAPENIVNRQVAEINKWVKITGLMDPSRNWVSGDGETQSPTDLPTIIGHYGDEGAWRDWSGQGKVWGIGESGMAYYGTPLQTSAYNGDKSFESQQSRMEGVALEATKLLELQKKYKASYNSIFNIVWYGLQPLDLGLKNTQKAPTAEDGVFFKPFQEGKPGVQPERLGPYTTTLNPGYDPALPLYRTWPLFDAIKNEFSTDMKTAGNAAEKIKNSATLSSVKVSSTSLRLFSSDPDSALYKSFMAMGIPVNKSVNEEKYVLIIDGIYPPQDPETLKTSKTILQRGGRVLIWGVDPSTIKTINRYLPMPVELTDRKSTSFIVTGQDSLLSGLNNKDFYFTELSNKPVLHHGLAGQFASKGKILLEAANTDWSTWNKQSEYLKTAAVLRSEREAKASGNALVSIKESSGTLYLMALDPGILYRSSLNLLKNILANIGVFPESSYNSDQTAIGENGKVEKALLLASFDISGKTDDEISHINFLENAGNTDYYPGQEVNNHIWQQAASSDGCFNFSQLRFKGPRNQAVSYLSFWIYSPRSLSNLLLEPDMPRIDLYLNTGNSYDVMLNSNLIKTAAPETNPGMELSPAIKSVPLEKGWNHFVIKSVHKKGDWKIGIQLRSDKAAFLKNEIKSQIFY
jgi:hypothetical protein